MRRTGLIAALLVAGLVLSACSSAPSQTPAPDNGAAAGPPAGPSAVSDVLTFSAPLLAGGQIDGESLRGQALALWFWAPW